MATYGYSCKSCGFSVELSTSQPSDIQCSCGGSFTRIYAFSIAKSFQPHFNPSVGRYVTSRSDLNDAFKVISDDASTRTGIYHNFKPYDVQDHEAFGLTSDDLEDAKESLGKGVVGKPGKPNVG